MCSKWSLRRLENTLVGWEERAWKKARNTWKMLKSVVFWRKRSRPQRISKVEWGALAYFPLTTSSYRHTEQTTVPGHATHLLVETTHPHAPTHTHAHIHTHSKKYHVRDCCCCIAPGPLFWSQNQRIVDFRIPFGFELRRFPIAPSGGSVRALLPKSWQQHIFDQSVDLFFCGLWGAVHKNFGKHLQKNYRRGSNVNYQKGRRRARKTFFQLHRKFWKGAINSVFFFEECACRWVCAEWEQSFSQKPVPFSMM